ncbi:nucleotidyltransferase family protein [Luteipulveratus mongoliensis]|nr:nucleotidyltransferase family protein [Luteipulveratus mongoliensis]
MTAGILLAAGAGRRFGGPKALVEIDGEPMVLRALRALREGTVDPVLVVVGAHAAEVSALLAGATAVVINPDWDEGMSSSLRAGLNAVERLDPRPDAVLLHLVDLPWVGAEAVRRLSAVAGPEVIARAAYDGVPGHPVVIGREHWAAVAAGATGDKGARSWLAGRSDVLLVECGDIARGQDVDTPADLER